MRILVTSDLHYNIARSKASAEKVAARACQAGGDALVLVGDTAGADLTPLRDALQLFASFHGMKLLVPGNHCLWCYGGGDSMERYRVTLPQVAAEEGFVMLDNHPQALGVVGLAGSIGWYDYSFADKALGIPLPFYEAKVSPGAANYLGLHELVDSHRAGLQPRHMSMGMRWMDGQYVNLGMTDAEFTELLAAELHAQLVQLSAACERIVVFMHHLPFAELVPQGRPDRFAFAAAYMGAARFGEVLRGFPKITHVFCGHSHWRSQIRVGNMDVLAIGSTYMDKRLEILDI